jgi:hypothetical protein
MNCPAQINGVECGLETTSASPSPKSNSRNDLIEHRECEAGHKWHYNLSRQKSETCDCLNRETTAAES